MHPIFKDGCLLSLISCVLDFKFKDKSRKNQQESQFFEVYVHIEISADRMVNPGSNSTGFPHTFPWYAQAWSCLLLRLSMFLDSGSQLSKIFP